MTNFAPLRCALEVLRSKFDDLMVAIRNVADVSQRVRTFIASSKQQNLVFLKELIEAGKIRPVIDRTYALSETPQAIGYVGEGHARGKVVITVKGS